MALTEGATMAVTAAMALRAMEDMDTEVLDMGEVGEDR